MKINLFSGSGSNTFLTELRGPKPLFNPPINGGSATTVNFPGTTSLVTAKYGNGKYMIVRYYTQVNNVFYSSDGSTWNTSSMSSTNRTWQNLAMGNGKFVGLANSVSHSCVSTDGITWTEYFQGYSAVATKMCYGNGIFLALGNNRPYYSSDDGQTFNSRDPLPNASLQLSIMDVFYVGGKFVAAYTLNNPATETGILYSSNNGVSWTKSVFDSTSYNSFAFNGTTAAVVAGGPYVTPNSTIKYSTDGVNWNNAIVPYTYLDLSLLQSFGTSGSYFCFVLSSNTMFVTTDFSTYTQIALPDLSPIPYSIPIGPGNKILTTTGGSQGALYTF